MRARTSARRLPAACRIRNAASPTGLGSHDTSDCTHAVNFHKAEVAEQGGLLSALPSMEHLGTSNGRILKS